MPLTRIRWTFLLSVGLVATLFTASTTIAAEDLQPAGPVDGADVVSPTSVPPAVPVDVPAPVEPVEPDEADPQPIAAKDDGPVRPVEPEAEPLQAAIRAPRPATVNNGEPNAEQPAPAVPEELEPQIIFAVADPGDEELRGETQIAERLDMIGSVVAVPLSELSELEVVSADVVVISAATRSSNFKPYLLKANVPVVALKPANWNALGLVPPNEDGSTPLQSVDLLAIEADHPIAANVDPSVPLFADGARFSVGRGGEAAVDPAVGPYATVVASGPDGAALIAFAAGDDLGWAYRDPSDRAAACRVAFPGTGAGEALLSEAGLELLEASVRWAVGPDCATERAVPATPSLDASMCRTDAADEDRRAVDGELVERPANAEPNLSALWVRALVPATIDGETLVFVGGRFQTAYDADAARDDDGELTDGLSRMGVFACDLATGTVTPFEAPIAIDSMSPVGNGVSNERVRALAFDGTWLYIGGKFTLAGETDVVNLLRVDPRTGAVDETWTPDLHGSVSALAVDGDMLYAGGGIRLADGRPVTRLVRFGIGPDATGEADPDFAPLIEATIPVGNGEPFATVLALEIADGTVYVGGSFQFVNGEARNSIAALSTATGEVTDFAPSIGDNNFGVDPIPQVKDVVADGRGNIFLCGDWWLTAEEPGQTWQAYDIDNGADDPNVTDDELAISWIGQRSRVQPRPNQFNSGKFDAITGASAVDEFGVPWGPVTDGGIQACDYDPATDTLILGGHYERIGDYDQAFIDAGGPLDEDDYPTGHQAYEKVTAVDGTTGEILAWDPDVDSIRGLDAVAILPGGEGFSSQILVGGAITESDRTARESLARYGWRR